MSSLLFRFLPKNVACDFESLISIFLHSLHSLQLEILLTRLKQLERLNLMGISATVSSKSVNEISTFLGGIAYEAKFRPVVLEQFLARGNALFRIDDTGAVEDTPQRVVSVDNRLAAKAKRLHLAVDAAPVAAELIGFGSEAVPTLVFCGTKQDCESMALALAAVWRFTRNHERLCFSIFRF